MTEQQLVPYEETTVLAAFTAEEGLDPLVKQASDLVAEFEHDLTTVTGRAKTASLANKVAKFKVKLDDAGKELVADWKKQAKVVDINRKSMRDALDELKVEARKPLTEWEAAEEEKARLEAEELAAEKLRAEIEHDHEMALLMNEKFDREAAEEAARIEAERKAAADKAEADRQANEERIRAEAQEAERVRAAEEVAEAKRKAEAAEKERLEAETRERIQIEEAEKRRVEALDKAEQDKKIAVQREKDRVAEIAKAEKEAKERLEANKKHVGEVRKAAKESLMEIISEEDAKKIVLAISNGLIANVTITY